ncbi:GntR family transcriptional regulator [Saccharopolyspora halophila]|uniref:GntR family transcriptional regulator n=1 Tax=Saccharopolyspora halophila TaxID=405551 RepID=A0ABN3GQ76_9PSEU
MAPTIAMQVVHLLRCSELDRGAHVREQWVADSLGISRSPVRKALAYLAELGLLEREPNRGYFLARAAGEFRRVELSGVDDVEEGAYFSIGDDHLTGRLAADFTTAEICRGYGLTTRQAERVLARMEREDLVRRRPGRGWQFEQVLTTAEAHDQSYRFRMIVEPAALLEPGFTIDEDAFAVHRKQQEQLLRGDALLLPRGELFRVNAEFHEMVVSCAGNAYLLESLRRVNRIRRLVEYRHQAERQRIVHQAEEHLRLLDLLESGDLSAASEFLHTHLDAVRVRKTRPRTQH